MIKTVSMWTVTVLGALATGCAAEADDGVGTEDVAIGEVEQAVTLPGKTMYCGLQRAGAIAAQQTASAFYQFLTAGNLVGMGNSATAADQAAYAAAGGLGNLGATTFTAFYPPASNSGTPQQIKATNTAAAALKAMVAAGTLFLGDPGPGTICTLAAGVRGVYGQGGVSASTVVGHITSFATNAIAMGYPSGLPNFLTIDTGDTGGSSGVVVPPLPGGGQGPIGGTSSGGGGPIVIRPIFLIDPEPARLYQNLTGSNGTTGLATYVNSGDETTAYRWSASPQAGSVPPGAACSTVNIVAGTEIYKSIEVFANGTRRCK